MRYTARRSTSRLTGVRLDKWDASSAGAHLRQWLNDATRVSGRTAGSRQPQRGTLRPHSLCPNSAAALAARRPARETGSIDARTTTARLPAAGLGDGARRLRFALRSTQDGLFAGLTRRCATTTSTPAQARPAGRPGHRRDVERSPAQRRRTSVCRGEAGRLRQCHRRRLQPVRMPAADQPRDTRLC